MNGEVKSYKLNEPMTWAEFKAMPDDIKVAYIKALRGKYNVSDTKIFEMMGVSQANGQREIVRLGIARGKGRGGRVKWDKDGWYAWTNGQKVETKEAPMEWLHADNDSGKAVLDEGINVAPEVKKEEVKEEAPPADLKFAEMKYEPPTMVAPRCGTMHFEGNAREALATVSLMLGDENVRLCVTWEVRNED